MTGRCDGPTAIIAPPPTPNGDLHVGHLSGPYFGADVLARYLRLRGNAVVAALSVDLNQSYVVTTADRMGVDPNKLARDSHHDIASTLSAARMEFDIIGMPDAPYEAYIKDWFLRLHKAGVFQLRSRDVPYDTARQRYMFESYASGRCTTCLSETKGNICEACGHPNDPAELYDLRPTGGRADDTIEMRRIYEYVLDLEEWKEGLKVHLRKLPNLRPSLRRLIDELLSKPLPPFPITFPSTWGIPAPFPEATDLVLNVWAEMVPGHYYWLEAARKKSGNASVATVEEQAHRYIQFLGFDNSFFYAVAHFALALAAKSEGIEALLPSAIITNEFYQLENSKFSTSQGHLIWGRELLKQAALDDVRLYLALSNPEFNQSNFSINEFEKVVEQRFRRPLEKLIITLNALSPTIPASISMPDIGWSMIRRFESAYNVEQPSLRIAALTLANGLEFANSLSPRDDGGANIKVFAQALAAGAFPIVPESAARIWNAVGQTGPVTWPRDELAAIGQI